MPLYTVVGGEILPPIIIDFNGVIPVTEDQVAQQVVMSAVRALPILTQAADLNGRKLAIVGGGPSIVEKIETLQAWDGEIWAINGAFGWCKENGIEATFIAADAHEIVAQWAEGAVKALIPSRSHPLVFEELKSAEVELFDLDGEHRIFHGSSTATAAIHLGFLKGYRHLTFFGCESCYFSDMSHAYQHEARDHELIIRCNGEEFLTAPDFYLQAKELQTSFATAKRGLYEESGGLLRAMIAAKGEHHIAWISGSLYETLKFNKESEAA